MKKIIILGMWTLFLLSPQASGMDRFDIVSTSQMKQMLDDRAGGKIDFVLVNTLDEIIFKHSSIPGSINVPWSRVNELKHRLGENKSKLIIPY